MSEEKPHYQTSYSRVIAGTELLFNGEGFLLNPTLWTEEIFEVLAREAGIEEITDKHLAVVRFIRKFYAEQGRPPLNHHLKVGTKMSLTELETLFPGGILRGAHRLAGMRGSRGCKG